jgi:hypothetical protein
MIKETYDMLKLRYKTSRIDRNIRKIDELLYHSDDALFEYGPFNQEFLSILVKEISKLEKKRENLTEQKNKLENKFIVYKNAD